MNIKGLEAAIMPIIEMIAPPQREPTSELSKQLKKLIEDELGVNLYSEIINRFIVHACEENPETVIKKLHKITAELTDISGFD